MPLRLIRNGTARTYDLMARPATVGDSVVKLVTPRLYGDVRFTIGASGPAQVGLLMPCIFTVTGERYRDRISDWRLTSVNGGGVFMYAHESATTLSLPPGYYMEGVEVSRWGGGGEITSLQIRN